MRTIITTGEKKGIIDIQNDIGLSGLFTTKLIEKMKAKTSGKVTGIINCCVSVSLSTAEPIAAKMALYSKYPPRK
ncbi:hypothetical protein D3C80_1547580 [compost metagenome]